MHVRTWGLVNQELHQSPWFEKQWSYSITRDLFREKKKNRIRTTHFEKYVLISGARLKTEAKGTGAQRCDLTWGSGLGGGGGAQGCEEPPHTHAENSPELEKRLRTQERTHHFRSKSHREMPTAQPASRALGGPASTPARPDTPRSDGTSCPVPEHAPGPCHWHRPCHPSCAAASMRTGRGSPQQAWPELTCTGARCWKPGDRVPLPPRGGPASVPAPRGPTSPSRGSPTPPAGLPLASRRLSV